MRCVLPADPCYSEFMESVFSQSMRSRVPGVRAVLVALLIGAMASQSAFAGGRGRGGGHGHGHGHGHVHNGGVGFGLFVAAPLVAYSLYRPYYSPAYYPQVYYPPVYNPPVVFSQPSPPVYIEQGSPPPPQSYRQSAPNAASQPAQSWWYYCAGTQTYYPYVRECPTGWERVSPQPPS